MISRKAANTTGNALKESLELQKRLRQLTHQVLAAQEDERKKISRELQDEIAQTLLGINVRLLSLKQEARSNTKGLKNEIASTQRLVVKSARSVRQVARKIRRFMKRKLLNFSRRYQAALRMHLKQGRHAGLESARGLGEPGAGRRLANAGPGQTPRADPGHGSIAGLPGRQTRRAHQTGGNFLCRGDHAHRENASQRAGGHRPIEKIHRDA